MDTHECSFFSNCLLFIFQIYRAWCLWSVCYCILVLLILKAITVKSTAVEVQKHWNEHENLVADFLDSLVWRFYSWKHREKDKKLRNNLQLFFLCKLSKNTMPLFCIFPSSCSKSWIYYPLHQFWCCQFIWHKHDRNL